MSTRESSHDEHFNSLMQKAINNQDHHKVTILIRSALRKQKYIDLTSELTHAVALGNKNLVELIYPYYRGTPKLIPKIALSKTDQKHLNCMLFLLDNGFTIKPRDPDMRIFMHSLIMDRHDFLFTKLMNHDINVNLIDYRTGYSLIHTACLANRMRIVKFLIQRNADVNAEVQENDGSVPKASTFLGKTALFIAVETTSISMIKFLLKNGANLNDSWDLLASAIQKQRQDIIQILLKHNANVNITNNHGETLLHYCVSIFPEHSFDAFKSEVVKMLLDCGADVNVKTECRSTPLFDAIEHAHCKVIKVLMSYNANIFTTKNGNNLIHLAIGRNNYGILEMLWKLIPSGDYGIFINGQNDQGQTPLHIGSINGNIKGVKSLLSNNANVNLTDNNGKTCLHIAIEVENLAIVKALLEKDANINIRDKNGQTPIHYAAKINQNGVIFIQYLISHGAHVNSVDINGRVPLHFACNIKNTQTVNTLLKNGAIINIKDKLEQTPLHWAYNTKPEPVEDEKLFKLLVANKVIINCTDFSGNSPLHYAVANGSVAIIKLLLKAGVNIDIMNKKNKTAVDYVSKNMLSMFNLENSHDKIAQYLREHIIKLKIAKLSVNNNNIKLAYKVNNKDGNVWIKHYEDSCKEELSRMKQKKFDGSNVTYYDVLTDSSNCKAFFTLDDNVILKSMSDELDVNFSLYADILRNAFLKSKKMT